MKRQFGLGLKLDVEGIVAKSKQLVDPVLDEFIKNNFGDYGLVKDIADVCHFDSLIVDNRKDSKEKFVDCYFAEHVGYIEAGDVRAVCITHGSVARYSFKSGTPKMIATRAIPEEKQMPIYNDQFVDKKVFRAYVS